MEYVETETLNDTHRLALSHIDLALEELGLEELGVYVLAPRASKHLDRGDSTAALAEIQHQALDADSALLAMARHLTRNGYANRVITPRGYSQGEWITAIAYLDTAATGTPEEYAGETLADYLDRYASWLWGDTYVLEIETRVTYTAPGYADIDKWHPVDGTAALIATQRNYPANNLRDLAGDHGIDLTAYAIRESETV